MVWLGNTINLFIMEFKHLRHHAFAIPIIQEDWYKSLVCWIVGVKTNQNISPEAIATWAEDDCIYIVRTLKYVILAPALFVVQFVGIARYF